MRWIASGCFVFLYGSLLAACGGGGGGSAPGGSAPVDEVETSYCHSVAPPGAMAVCDRACIGVGNAHAAFDGSFETAASMGAGTQAMLSGAMPLQPGGSIAGVYFVFPATGEGITLSIATYLDGVQQETAGPASRGGGLGNVCPIGMECTFTQGASFVGFATDEDYDEIVVTVSNTGTDGLLISELCIR